jgi:hypothetical protein
MLRLKDWAKWATPLLIVVMLLGVSCSFVAPPPAPSPPPAPPEPENHKPVINYITAPQQTAPSSNTRVTCVATDADGDILTYAWAADSGMIIGTGDTVTWNAPAAAGDYIVTAIVTDSKGGEARDSVTIDVIQKPNRSPIAALIVRKNKDTAITITEETGPITAKRWSSTEIECKAEDPDGDTLSYRWSATDGQIDGDGPIVKYIASATGDFAVTATVVDSSGAQTKCSVYFHVPCCGAGGG